MHFKKSATAALVAVATLFPLQASERLQSALEGVSSLPPKEEVKVSAEPKEITAPTPPPEPRYIGKGFSKSEAKILSFFQDKGIKDKAALSVVLGNIKQESRFHSNICEGGHRISYGSCRSGGYGLIQWTSSGRYHGLGRYASRTGGNPSSLDTQLGYLVTEVQWKSIEPTMKTEGLSIGTYMKAAHRWLGWGIHGNRTHYAHQYFNLLVLDK